MAQLFMLAYAYILCCVFSSALTSVINTGGSSDGEQCFSLVKIVADVSGDRLTYTIYYEKNLETQVTVRWSAYVYNSYVVPSVTSPGRHGQSSFSTPVPSASELPDFRISVRLVSDCPGNIRYNGFFAAPNGDGDRHSEVPITNLYIDVEPQLDMAYNEGQVVPFKVTCTHGAWCMAWLSHWYNHQTRESGVKDFPNYFANPAFRPRQPERERSINLPNGSKEVSYSYHGDGDISGVITASMEAVVGNNGELQLTMYRDIIVHPVSQQGAFPSGFMHFFDQPLTKNCPKNQVCEVLCKAYGWNLVNLEFSSVHQDEGLHFIPVVDADSYGGLSHAYYDHIKVKVQPVTTPRAQKIKCTATNYNGETFDQIITLNRS